VWDSTLQMPSVVVLVLNRDTEKFVLVRQFRPSVYLSAAESARTAMQRAALASSPGAAESPGAATPPLATAPETIDQETSSTALRSILRDSYGASMASGSAVPFWEGVTLEPCAGLIDDPSLSAIETAAKEVTEELGYVVDPSSITEVGMSTSSVGTGGNAQTLCYCEVVTRQKDPSAGGGLEEEGEYIQVAEVDPGALMHIIDPSSKDTANQGVQCNALP